LDDWAYKRGDTYGTILVDLERHRVIDLLHPSARLTNRLRTALQAVGAATGGEVGARLAPKLSMQATPSTLLRCLRALSSPPPPPVRILGVDDWAYKRGDTYGTILVE